MTSSFQGLLISGRHALRSDLPIYSFCSAPGTSEYTALKHDERKEVMDDGTENITSYYLYMIANINSWLDVTSPLQAQNPDHGQYSTQLSKSMFLITVEKLPELLAVQADFAWLVVTDLLLLVESPLGYSMWKTGLSAWMKGA